MKRLSIIIPVYNVERYLERCLASLFRQNLEEGEFEVVIVDDGSTDKSFAVAHKFALKHTNVRVCQQQNGGQSVARNKGMQSAIGRYLYFVDSDDLLIDNTIKEVLEVAEKKELDIVTFLNQCSNEENPKPTKVRNNPFKGVVQNGVDFIGSHNYNNGAWGYLIHREFVSKKGLKFEEGRFCEDGMFTMTALLNAQRVSAIERDVYMYMFNNQNSTVGNKNLAHRRKMMEDFMYAISYFKHLRDENVRLMTDSCRKRIDSRISNYIFYLFIRLLKYPNSRALINKYVGELKNIGLYPFQRMAIEETPEMKFTVLHLLMQHKNLWILLNSIYTIIKR